MKYTFQSLEEIAEQRGFIFERQTRGGGEDKTNYDLTTNDPNLGAGTTASYRTLKEALADITEIQNGVSPLNGNKI